MVTSFANGAGAGVVTQLSQPAPNGVLIETELPAGAAAAEPCQVAGAASWWYDPAAYSSGADYAYGQGAGPSGEPAFAAGTSYTLALPSLPPVSFAGALPAGPQSCSQSVAFVVETGGSYRLQFTASGGPLTFQVSPEQLAGQGTRPLTITGSVAITQELTPGVWSISLNNGSSGTTAWSISATAADATSGTDTTSAAGTAAPPKISNLKPIRLAQRPPTLQFISQAVRATTLDLLLMSANGRKLAHWTIRTRPGRFVVSLVLPASARHPGQDKLRITQPETGWQIVRAVAVSSS
jgi:hypothetical protein